jgi:hypothetical protein
MKGITSKLVEGLLVLVSLLVAARLLLAVAGQLLAPVLTLVIVVAVIAFAVRGPRGGGSFHR